MQSAQFFRLSKKRSRATRRWSQSHSGEINNNPVQITVTPWTLEWRRSTEGCTPWLIPPLEESRKELWLIRGLVEARWAEKKNMGRLYLRPQLVGGERERDGGDGASNTFVLGFGFIEPLIFEPSPHSDMSFNERRITIESGFTFSFFPPPSFNSPGLVFYLFLSLPRLSSRVFLPFLRPPCPWRFFSQWGHEFSIWLPLEFEHVVFGGRRK